MNLDFFPPSFILLLTASFLSLLLRAIFQRVTAARSELRLIFDTVLWSDRIEDLSGRLSISKHVVEQAVGHISRLIYEPRRARRKSGVSDRG